MVSLAFFLSLLFLILAPSGVSFSTSMMKFSSAPEKKNSEKPASAHSCLYCKKVFTNHQALGGHLKTHNASMKSAWRKNPPGSSGNSIGFTSNSSNPLSNHEPGNYCGGVGNYLIPKRSCSIKTIPVHATFAPLGFGLNGVGQLSTDEGRTYKESKPFFYAGALQNSQHSLKPSFTFSTITNPYPFLGSNQSPGSNEIAVAGLSFMDPCPCSCQNESCPYKMKCSLTRDKSKRMHPIDTLGNFDVTKALKRHKTVSDLHMEIEKSQTKELPLVKDLEKPFSGLVISFDAKQKVSADIDLSLHL